MLRSSLSLCGRFYWKGNRKQKALLWEATCYLRVLGIEALAEASLSTLMKGGQFGCFFFFPQHSQNPHPHFYTASSWLSSWRLHFKVYPSSISDTKKKQNEQDFFTFFRNLTENIEDLLFTASCLLTGSRVFQSRSWPLEPKKILPIQQFIKARRFRFPQPNNAADKFTFVCHIAEVYHPQMSHWWILPLLIPSTPWLSYWSQ